MSQENLGLPNYLASSAGISGVSCVEEGEKKLGSQESKKGAKRSKKGAWPRSLKTLNSSVFMTKFNMMYVSLHFEVFEEREMILNISNLVVPHAFLTTFRPFGYAKKPHQQLRRDTVTVQRIHSKST